ncbi:hypothetical protein OJF2_77800 [Aquisphaera giovannonii]|uniref:DUF721 domain-containing protein n=1 Tax=Aquisphaera giovannonii TaxID=406548 RepID=A0A5B9WEU1_9BACT|nr:DUF721 domain-containing protein [Aquisphaera giovannonii]QEH39168.1 hypothetical protein OJF2_77800 [Aquisphaera giovannonii]
MANPNPGRRHPRPLSEVLGELFAARGYGRLQALGELEEVWNRAVGEPQCRQTRVGDVRRGVLNVTVSHPTLLEELAAFRKGELLAALRAGVTGATIHDIRFRVGLVREPDDEPGPASGPGPRPAAAPPSPRAPGRGMKRAPRASKKKRDDRG